MLVKCTTTVGSSEKDVDFYVIHPDRSANQYAPALLFTMDILASSGPTEEIISSIRKGETKSYPINHSYNDNVTAEIEPMVVEDDLMESVLALLDEDDTVCNVYDLVFARTLGICNCGYFNASTHSFIKAMQYANVMDANMSGESLMIRRFLIYKGAITLTDKYRATKDNKNFYKFELTDLGKTIKGLLECTE
jgi:hypothetical protein